MTRGHPIGVVVVRTGIPHHVLRAWERRYGAVTPRRTETGRRFYTDEDIQRLRLIRQVVDAGRRISDVASLSMKELEGLVREDHAPNRTSAGVERGKARKPGGYIVRALEAAERLDEHGLERVLTEASVALGSALLRRTVIAPLLREIGDRWRNGSLRIAHEHLASAMVRTYLGVSHRSNQLPESAPRIVLATPAGQLHELGALMAVEAALDIGWRAIYLGPNLPAEEIAAAAHDRKAHAIALAVVYPTNDPQLREQLRSLRRFCGPELPILLGGRALPGYHDVVEEIGAIAVADFEVFQDELERLASNRGD